MANKLSGSPSEPVPGKPVRVGVLFGGKSIEREVSFNSGRTVCDHLDSSLYEVVPIYQTVEGDLYILPWYFLHRGKTSDFEGRLTEKVSWDGLKELVDFVYISVHGRWAEDGSLQGMLDILDIPYLGSRVFSSAAMMDKSFQKELLRFHGIKVPNGIVVKNSEDVESLKYPLIVKPCSEGSSLGISAVFKPEELSLAIKLASTCDKRRIQNVLVEEKIEGMEFVCIALQYGDSWKALPITEIVPEDGTHFFDYDQKYMPGRACKITPARCSEEDTAKIQELCLNAVKILEGRTICRIDGFLTKDDILLVDAQPITGMGPSTFLFHQAAEIGMSHTELINHMITTELKNYNIKVNTKKKQSMNEPKIKVAVLMGGDSYEREISLESGRNVCYKLSPSKYDVIPIFVNDKMELYRLSQRLLIQNSTREIDEQLTDEIKMSWSNLAAISDFVFIAMHGGKGENGSVQGAIEMIGLPYNGSSVLTSSLCADKYKTNEFLSNLGFHTPKSILVSQQDLSLQDLSLQGEPLQDLSLQDLSFPVVVKPHDDGCSNLVTKIDSMEELNSCLKSYFATGKKLAMIEECIIGKELTCGVIGNNDVLVLPPSEPKSQSGILSIEEKFLPGSGENITPAILSKHTLGLVKQVMEKVYTALDCKGYARIDCFYQDADVSPTGEERIVILEVNTLPGLTPATCLFHQAAEIGLKPMEFIGRIVELGFDNHKHQIDLDKIDSARLSS